MTGYIARHWRGQFPLGQSYWVNGVLVLLPFLVWFELAGDYLVAHPPLRPLPFVAALGPAFVVFALMDAWAAVGIWRSAGRRILFGHFGWAWISRIAVLMNFVVLLLAAVMLVNETHTLIWGPSDLSGHYEVTLRGTTAVFRGRLTPSAADDLELLLSDKTVRRLAIAESDGGDADAALRIARLARARKIFVVALSQCDGPCTLLLAAGGARAAVPQSVIVFGANAPDALQFYRQAGLAGPLLAVLNRLRPGASYEPTLRTLIENRFLTDIFVDATRRYARAPGWCAKNLVVCGRTGRQNRGPANRSGGSGDGT
jgi:hypothetical protein